MRGIRCFAVSCLFMGALLPASPRSSLLLLPPFHAAMCPAPSSQMPAPISRGQPATRECPGSHSCVVFCTEPVCTRSCAVHRHTCPRLGRTATPKEKRKEKEERRDERCFMSLNFCLLEYHGSLVCLHLFCGCGKLGFLWFTPTRTRPWLEIKCSSTAGRDRFERQRIENYRTDIVTLCAEAYATTVRTILRRCDPA